MMENVFWETFTEACKARKTSPSAVAKSLGLSSGSPTAWKRGAVPNAFTIAQIASLLEWPMQKFYGLAEPEQKENSPSGELDTKQVKFALFGTEEITDEKLNEVLRYAAYVKDL